MGKIKINLTSGNIIEKPVVTAFKNANGEYVILDNESNGSMGLPIICISKKEESSLQKIYDPNEWGQVKESLKSIIAGNSADYLNVPNDLNAQDDFFTQLSLPVQSFDLLKSSYMPKEEVGVISKPAVEEIASVVETTETPVPHEPVNIVPDEPIVPEPVVMPKPEVNIEPSEIKIEVPTMPEEIKPDPVINDKPLVEEIPNPDANTNKDVEQLKESFLKACENMFDALYNKFNK